MQTMANNLKALVEKTTGQGKDPIVLTSPLVRRRFKKLIEPMAPDLAVLSYNEIEQSVEIHSEGVLKL
jgi:flagellar biosynthesis protein FlhA